MLKEKKLSTKNYVANNNKKFQKENYSDDFFRQNLKEFTAITPAPTTNDSNSRAILALRRLFWVLELSTSLADNLLGLHCRSTFSSAQCCFHSLPFTCVDPYETLILQTPSHCLLPEKLAYDRDPTQAGPPLVWSLSIGIRSSSLLPV